MVGVEGCGRSLFHYYLPVFWTGWGKPGMTSAWIANFSADIAVRNLPKMKQDCISHPTAAFVEKKKVINTDEDS
jgi:hypothetical protein